MGLSLPLLSAPVLLPIPAALFDFDLTADTLDPSLTFTRSTTKNLFDTSGTRASQATDALGPDYNPATLARRGRPLEPARTNSLRNNTMVGAVVGTPGTKPTNWVITSRGATVDVAGLGTDSGIDYIDLRCSGTPTSSGTFSIYFDTATGITAATGQTWAISAYLKQVAGSPTNITPASLAFAEQTSGGSFVAFGNGASAAFPTTGLLSANRFSFVRTLNGGATVGALQGGVIFNVTSGLAIDITIRIGLPQIEQGAGVSSVIRTSGSAVTRTADVLQLTSLPGGFVQGQGTFAVEWELQETNGALGAVLDFGDGTSSNRMIVGRYAGTSSCDCLVVTGNSTQAGSYNTTNASAVGAINRLCFRYQNADAFAAWSAGQVFSGAPPSIFTNGTKISIGGAQSGTGTGQPNAWLRRVRYWPTCLTNNQCNQIAAGLA